MFPFPFVPTSLVSSFFLPSTFSIQPFASIHSPFSFPLLPSPSPSPFSLTLLSHPPPSPSPSPSLSLFLILPPVYFLFQSLFSHKKSSRRDIYKNWKSSTTQKWSEMNQRRKKKLAGCFNDTKKNYADAMMTRKHRSDAMITWTVWSDTMMQKGRLDMRKSECVNMKAKKPRAALCYYTDVNRKQTRGQLCIVNSKKSILRDSLTSYPKNLALFWN